MKLRLLACLIVLAAGCDAGPAPGTDGGPTTLMDGRVIQRDGGGRDGGQIGDPDAGCAARVEICGDRMDQNCDGRDQSCGDNDSDGWQACRPGDDLTMCDCNDSRPDAYPPAGPGVPGAAEACDGIDNDCDGRIDEASQCCPACMALDDHARGDVCTPSGACDCSTAPGDGPCPSGQTCCGGGCVDLQTDVDNCGLCNSPCTRCLGSDTCTSGACGCGGGAPCDFTDECVSGTCQPRTPACGG